MLARKNWSSVLFMLKRHAAMVLISATLFLATFYLSHSMAQERARVEAQVAAQRSALSTQTEAHETKAIYQSRFDALQHQGAIDSDPRLDWAEAVQRDADALHLPSVTYELELAVSTTLAEPKITSRVAASRMNLHLSMRHEGELLRFLDQLRDAPAIFWPQRCLLSNINGSEDEEAIADKARFKADCEVVWLVVQTGP